ncbi:MAG: Rpn family recombination-promoting nuclease/putative transposase [Bacteroidales bacterium]|nr:Rpn family recombination-promoting nuclease/putative transposase [Bacteroidales bacterium]
MEEKIQEKSKQRYVDILSNGGFKAFFGDENNKEVVRELLNTLLPDHRQIKEIDYQPTEHQGPIIGYSKEFKYDFMCCDVSGAKFIVETQRYREKSWFKRCVSYASRAYDRQNKTGFDYDVPPVYLIGLMGVEIEHPDKEYWNDKYISEYTFREKECHDLLDETIVIIFAELTRFHKTADECVTLEDKLMYLLKNSGKMTAPPKWAEEKPCKDLLDAFEIDDFSKTKREQYDKDMYDEKRRNGELAAARDDGRAEGLAQGHAEGRIEGREEANMEVARKMLAAGMPVEQIVQFTGMDRGTVEKL